MQKKVLTVNIPKIFVPDVINSKKIALITKLSGLKIKTINGAQLTPEDRGSAEKVAKEMAANGWLTTDEEEWCKKQNIIL